MHKIQNDITVKIIDQAAEKGLLKVITSKKTTKDLFKYAFEAYGQTEQQVREILTGMGKFDENKWFEYLDKLRLHWDHVLELKKENPYWDKSRRDRLFEIALGAKWVHAEPDAEGYTVQGYTLVGTPEAISAYWELQDLEREIKVKKWRQRYGFIGRQTETVE